MGPNNMIWVLGNPPTFMIDLRDTESTLTAYTPPPHILPHSFPCIYFPPGWVPTALSLLPSPLGPAYVGLFPTLSCFAPLPCSKDCLFERESVKLPCSLAIQKPSCAIPEVGAILEAATVLTSSELHLVSKMASISRMERSVFCTGGAHGALAGSL